MQKILLFFKREIANATLTDMVAGTGIFTERRVQVELFVMVKISNDKLFIDFKTQNCRN